MYNITNISSEHSGLRKNGSESTRIGEGQTYNITYISSEHSGLYYCKAENRHGASDSNATYLDVHYSPRNTSASLSPSGDHHYCDSVTLTCSSDANPPVHTYTWYKRTGDGTVLQGTGRVLNFTLNRFTGADVLYHCEARNKVGSENSTTVGISLAVPEKHSSLNPVVGGVIGGMLAGFVAGVLTGVLTGVAVYKRVTQTRQGGGTTAGPQTADKKTRDNTYEMNHNGATSSEYDPLTEDSF
ncbi:B-cell receptor CD22-like [Sardina pilchardus]|uniref:B-cell receptor CD22-like n=1 Tax=Sardina pilchardus TaxID=27697 RepID=UPI002E0DB60E